jgi:CRP/FNR family transcriptional regulator, cyclic AMP receptor protein
VADEGSGHVIVEQTRGSAPERMSLARWPLFRDLHPQTLAALTAVLMPEAASSGHLILLDGERYARLYLLVRGFASQSQVSVEGREHVLDYMGPGRFLNIVAVLDGGTQLGTIRALTDVDLYSIPFDAFLSLAETWADLALALARLLARENRQLSETARGLALDPVRKRLAGFLLEYAENAPPQQRWTQDLIAAHIGTVRDVVGRILRDLAQEGLIKRERGELVILDRAGLEGEARGTGG